MEKTITFPKELFQEVQNLDFSKEMETMFYIFYVMSQKRKNKGLTPSALAKEAQVKESVVVNIEYMIAEDVKLIDVLKICTALNIDLKPAD